jgi:hypothetical protein
VVKIHLDANIKEDLNKNQGEKQKLNAVAEKREHSLNEKSEN